MCKDHAGRMDLASIIDAETAAAAENFKIARFAIRMAEIEADKAAALDEAAGTCPRCWTQRSLTKACECGPKPLKRRQMRKIAAAAAAA